MATTLTSGRGVLCLFGSIHQLPNCDLDVHLRHGDQVMRLSDEQAKALRDWLVVELPIKTWTPEIGLRSMEARRANAERAAGAEIDKQRDSDQRRATSVADPAHDKRAMSATDGPIGVSVDAIERAVASDIASAVGGMVVPTGLIGQMAGGTYRCALGDVRRMIMDRFDPPMKMPVAGAIFGDDPVSTKPGDAWSLLQVSRDTTNRVAAPAEPTAEPAVSGSAVSEPGSDRFDETLGGGVDENYWSIGSIARRRLLVDLLGRLDRMPTLANSPKIGLLNRDSYRQAVLDVKRMIRETYDKTLTQ